MAQVGAAEKEQLSQVIVDKLGSIDMKAAIEPLLPPGFTMPENNHYITIISIRAPNGNRILVEMASLDTIGIKMTEHLPNEYGTVEEYANAFIPDVMPEEADG